MIQSKSAHALAMLNQCIMTYVLSCFIRFSFSAGMADAPDMPRILISNLAMIIGTTVSYILYIKANSLFVYISGHAILCAAFYFILPPIAAVTNIIIMVVLMLIHIHESSKPEMLPLLAPQVADLILFLVVYFLNHFSLKNATVEYLCIYGCALSVVIFCIFRYCFQMDTFLKTHGEQNGYNFPMEQVRHNGKMMLGIFLILTVILMFLIPLSGLETLTGLLKTGIIQLLVVFFKLLGLQPGTTHSETPTAEELSEEEAVTELVQQASATMPQWLNLLVYIVFTIVIVCALAIATGFLVYALYCFFRSFGAHKQEEYVEKDYVETAQSIAPKRTAKRQRENLSNPTAVVRKLYRHVIRNHRSKGTIIPEAATPREIERLVNLQTEQPDTIAFHNLYEKARYARDGASPADADMMKSISRKQL